MCKREKITKLKCFLFIITDINLKGLKLQSTLFSAPGLCSLFARAKMLYRRLSDDVIEFSSFYILAIFRKSTVVLNAHKLRAFV